MAAGLGALTEPLELFAVAPPGLEETVARELTSLGMAARPEPGGVAWRGTLADLMRANLHARTPTRILVRVARFNARTFHELERYGRRVPWLRFLGERRALLRITCRKSRLYHEGAVAQRLHEAITEVAGRDALPPAQTEDIDVDEAQLFVVRLYRDTCTISADASGARLHLRGYRQALAKAPLRENLAAAMLLASGWDRRAPLFDPLCGSGTIAIEAALLARDIAPGMASADRTPRPFAFTHWPDNDSDTWEEMVRHARERLLPRSPALLLASDRAGGALRAARANAERAGVQDDIAFSVHRLEDIEPPEEPGWVVTNPPYGVRVGDAGRTLSTLDRLAHERLAGWTVSALVNEPQPARDAAFATRNGGIPVQFRVRRPG